MSPNPKCTPITDTEKPHKLYAKIIETPFEIKSRKWNTFLDYDTVIPLKKITKKYPWISRNSPFKYIIDEL